MTEFLLACTLMGLGIGADVGIATVLQAGQLNSANKAGFWLGGVTLTHTLFPMFGYLLTYFSLQHLPLLTPLVGLLAFSFIAYFLWHEYVDLKKQRCDQKQKTAPEKTAHSVLCWGLILTVSWDALWSGPAKSAQVIGWPEWRIWCSFILVGMVVALCGLMGLYIGRKFAALKFNGQNSSTFKLSAGQYLLVGQWLQYSVIGYFALLAILRYTFSFDIGAWQVFILSSVGVAMVLFPVGQFISRVLTYFLPAPILSRLKVR
jgi:hypothetical protein